MLGRTAVLGVLSAAPGSEPFLPIGRVGHDPRGCVDRRESVRRCVIDAEAIVENPPDHFRARDACIIGASRDRALLLVREEDLRRLHALPVCIRRWILAPQFRQSVLSAFILAPFSHARMRSPLGSQVGSRTISPGCQVPNISISTARPNSARSAGTYANASAPPTR